MRNHELVCRECPDCKIFCKTCRQNLDKETYQNHLEVCQLQRNGVNAARRIGGAAAAAAAAIRQKTYRQRVGIVANYFKDESGDYTLQSIKHFL